MGSCLSVEEDQQQQTEYNFSSHEQGESGESLTSPKWGSFSQNIVSVIPKNVEDLMQSPGNGNLNMFTYQEMMLATQNFQRNQVLGIGGFGKVYRGIVDSIPVAIKELDPRSVQGDREWLAEVNYLGQLEHPNLVKLLGYCCEGDQRLLVYEYMASESLEKHLFFKGSASLTWFKRLKIALDAANGLAFLHGIDKPIIYRDFKTSNILLDKDFNAKLSDFGLARVGPTGDQTHVSTRIMGTYGYAAPEYIMTGHLTTRSDVYGFGVVLIEILVGKRAVDKRRPIKEHNLVDWARPILNREKKLTKNLDPRIEKQYSTDSLVKVANLAYRCISPSPKRRPNMTEVIKILEPLIEHEMRRNETAQHCDVL